MFKTRKEPVPHYELIGQQRQYLNKNFTRVTDEFLTITRD